MKKQHDNIDHESEELEYFAELERRKKNTIKFDISFDKQEVCNIDNNIVVEEKLKEKSKNKIELVISKSKKGTELW